MTSRTSTTRAQAPASKKTARPSTASAKAARPAPAGKKTTRPVPAQRAPARAGRKPAAPVAAAPSPAAPGPQPVVVEAGKPKNKLVRDSFTIPKKEYAALQQLKERAAALKRPARKSEVLRAGISALGAMSDEAFLAVLASVPSLKTGRPKQRDAAKAPDA